MCLVVVDEAISLKPLLGWLIVDHIHLPFYNSKINKDYAQNSQYVIQKIGG